MRRFHEVDGRRGYFLVVSLPDGECSGGFESDCLTSENADWQADSINGAKAVFWQFLDEQPSAERDGRGWISKPAVRHLVGPVPLKSRDPNLHYLRGHRDEAEGVWAVCERWLLGRAPEDTPGSSPAVRI